MAGAVDGAVGDGVDGVRVGRGRLAGKGEDGAALGIAVQPEVATRAGSGDAQHAGRIGPPRPEVAALVGQREDEVGHWPSRAGVRRVGQQFLPRPLGEHGGLSDRQPGSFFDAVRAARIR